MFLWFNASAATLLITTSGVTYTGTGASVEHLTQLLLLSPNLRILDIADNQLTDLSASLISTLLSLPTLRTLDLSGNFPLGYSSFRPEPCAIHRFLSQLLVTASSSTLSLRALNVENTGMDTDCCHPFLEQVLSLGSKGLECLIVGPYSGFDVLPFAPLVRIISEDNKLIKRLAYNTFGESDEWEALADTLCVALERNKRLQLDTHKVARELLEIARTILHASPTALSSAAASPSSPGLSSTGPKPSDRVRISDLLHAFGCLSPVLLNYHECVSL